MPLLNTILYIYLYIDFLFLLVIFYNIISIYESYYVKLNTESMVKTMRRKKKKKVIKKTISIHTPKKLDKFQWLIDKDKLFDTLSIDEIIEELKANNIILDVKTILEEYDKIHSIQTLLEKYYAIYKKELDLLGDKNELFDDDAIFYLTNKIITENYDVETLSDPDFLSPLVDKFYTIKNSQKANHLAKILTVVNEYKQYFHTDDLNEIMSRTWIDIVDFIDTAYNEWLLNMPMTKEQIHNHLQLLDQFFKNYTINIDSELNIRIAFISIWMSQDKKLANAYSNELCELFPSYTISIYSEQLLALERNNKKDNFKEMQDLYYKALQCIPVSTEEQEALLYIKENYNYLKTV